MNRHDLVQRALQLLTHPIETGKPNTALKQQKALDPRLTIHPGSLVSWTRAGIAKEGFVDFIHVDDTGCWAFVSFGEDWSAVNLRYVRLSPICTQP